MKFLPTNLVFAVLLIIGAHPLVASNPGKDFLITLDGSKLTGFIKTIAIKQKKTQISFENDLGTTYTIDASTIFGFAFEEAGEMSLYESKFLNGEWQFLKVEKRGEAVSLYKSSERQLQYSGYRKSPTVVQEKNPQIWLQFKGEQPFRIYRITFRGVLRRKMKSYPDLAKMIGKRGFRYRNLSMIVDSYNRFQLNNSEELPLK